MLKNGSICEQGTHADLINKGGEYKDMWERQQQAQEFEQKWQACLKPENKNSSNKLHG